MVMGLWIVPLAAQIMDQEGQILNILTCIIN